MTKGEFKYFVWLQGLRGPEPQLWNEMQTVGGKPVKTLGEPVKLPDADPRELSKLAEDYPCGV